jgi:PRTRC genetic system protein C
MPIEIKPITRRFIYNGTELPDPNPSINLEACREIFAQTHPEIANAAIEDKTSGNVTTYTFVRSVGTKG